MFQWQQEEKRHKLSHLVSCFLLGCSHATVDHWLSWEFLHNNTTSSLALAIHCHCQVGQRIHKTLALRKGEHGWYIYCMRTEFLRYKEAGMKNLYQTFPTLASQVVEGISPSVSPGAVAMTILRFDYYKQHGHACTLTNSNAVGSF